VELVDTKGGLILDVTKEGYNTINPISVEVWGTMNLDMMERTM
jgi:hypothetical protein